MSIIQDQSAEVMNRVIESDYYVNRFDTVLIKNNMSYASIDQHEHSDRDLIKMWNDFWMILPDSPSIRTGPFFAVCDLAEHIFD